MMIFNSLSKADIHEIIDIELEGLYSRTKEMGFTVEISDPAKDFIADKGYDAEYGARPLARAIQKYIEDPLAEEIIQSRLNEGDLIKIKFDQDKKEVLIEIEKAKKKLKGKTEKSPKKSDDSSED
jgi:ATP-dependent Clp protease ATP-binding subunit ClpC